MQEIKAKFEITDLLPIGLTIVVIGIGMAYGIEVLDDTQDSLGNEDCTAGYWNSTSGVCQVSSTNQTAVSLNGNAYNATGDALTGVAKFPAKLPLVVTVIVAAVIIGILVRYLMVRFS